MVHTITSQCPFKTRIAKQFTQLITRIGRSKIHIVKSKFHRNFQPKHQNGRRVPINLKERVNNEIKKLLEEGHIEKMNNCSDQYFISPIVITVKRDQTIKLALVSKTLNKAIHKNKYQMPNIETLMNSISQIITNYKTEPADKIFFSTIDLKYAYSQLNLHPESAKHCNFNIVSGDMTGTYRFKTGFYGLTDMPAEFQKAMDYTLIGLKNIFCFLDDILIVSKGSEDDHFQLVLDCLKKLVLDCLRLSAKSVSKYDAEFLVATLSSIHSDAQLLQQKHNLLAHSLNKLYIDIDGENKNSSTNTEQVLTIDYVKPNPQTKVNELFAPRNNSSKLCSKQISNIKSAQRVRLVNVSSNLAAQKYNSNITSLKFNHRYSKHASRVHLTHNTKSFADQKYNSIFHPTNSINCTSAHDQRVHSIQNDSVFAHTYPTSKVNTSKLINTTSDLASRIRFSFNKLTPARQNSLLILKRLKCIPQMPLLQSKLLNTKFILNLRHIVNHLQLILYKLSLKCL